MKNCWSLKLSKLSILLFLFSHYTFAQLEIPKQDSHLQKHETYLFPIFPGKPNLLAGSMGELRSTHFHAGLDIRTNSVTGIPVRAANGGYVSRIIVGSYGYGKAIVLQHPDGNQTLYAHLDKFKGELADYVLSEHYSRKSFELDLFPEKNRLRINRGDTIALSGNTGGSQGPHLHFEIRDSSNQALNPLQFKFDEIIDTYAPTANKIALITLDSNSRINDKFGRFEFYLLKGGDTYSFAQPILASGNIGVELLATDRMNNSAFRFGINNMEMFLNGKKVFSQTIDKIDFEETRGIQNLFDYKVLKQKGQYFTKLFVDDGNTFDYHEGTIANGIISVDKEDVPVLIELKDTYGNKSEVTFSLKPSPKTDQLLLPETIVKPIDIDVFKNVMKVTSKACPENKLSVIVGGKVDTQLPSYGTSLAKVYLIDLRKALPDSISACGNTLKINLKKSIPSGQIQSYKSDFLEIKFEEKALYDTLYLTESYKASANSEVFTVGSNTTPLFKPVEIKLKPKRTYSESKTSVYTANGANLGGTWEQGEIRFMARDLGSFTILQDVTPPTITKIFLTGRTARFKIGDNRSGIASFEATIDGEWLLMDYEYKTGILLAERQDKTKILKGEFKLKVTDTAGNEKTFIQKIF
jgi:hypothetical protein